jgi:hypothetical protein
VAGHVFISYSHQDVAYVDRLVSHLRAQGLEVWVDHELHHGDRWAKIVETMIDGCAAFVVVMTPDAGQSEWVENEIAQAQEQDRVILPLLLAGKPFWRLKSRQYEDVVDGGLPSATFVARLRSLCDGEGSGGRPPENSARAERHPTLPPLPAPGDAPTWLPYRLRNGRQLVFRVVAGTVGSSSSDLEKEWDSLGTGVIHLVGSQDGSHVAAQSAKSVVVGRLSEAGLVQALRPVPAEGGDVRLVAIRHRRAQSVFQFSVLEVLLSTAQAVEIWVVDEDGRQSTTTLPMSVRSGAATDDGFLVITPDGQLSLLAPDGQRSTALTRLGGGWVDIDVSVSAEGPLFAALRVTGTGLAVSHTRAADELAEAPRATPGPWQAVRVSRWLGKPSTGRPADPSDDVWLVSANTQVSLTALASS